MQPSNFGATNNLVNNILMDKMNFTSNNIFDRDQQIKRKNYLFPSAHESDNPSYLKDVAFL